MEKNLIVSQEEITPIKSRITKMQKVVADLVVKDDPSLQEAVKILSNIKSVAKDIEAKKKEKTVPVNETLKIIRSLFLPFETAYQEAERIVKGKILKYNFLVEQERAEAEAKLAKRVESGNLKPETAAAKLEKIPEVANHVEVEQGSITFKRIPKYEVVDVSKLPVEFIQPNAGAIWKAVQSGIREIPGVHIWLEDNISGSPR